MSVIYPLLMPGQVVARPDWANALRVRREDLGIKQSDFPELTDDLISQGTVSDIERGKVNPLKLEARRLFAYIKALKWTPEDFFKATNLNPQYITEVSNTTGYRIDAFPINTRPMPVLGVAAGGKPYEYPVPNNLWRAGGAVFMVEGSSMDDGTDRAIREGDMVLVDTSITSVQPGKLYVLEILGDGYTIKQARKLNGEWVWLPFNPEHPALHPKEVRIVGQVYKVLRAGDV